MKFISSNTKSIYDIATDKKRSVCPECGLNRKKKGNSDLQYYKETNSYYCFHCESTFFEYKPNEAKQYVVPEWKNKTDLTDKAVKYFEGRMIKQDTLNELKIYSDNEWMPQFKKEVEVICFPYFVNESLINIKFRGAKKSFKLVSGAELVFYNFNALLEYKEIIIVEGEMDLLSYYTCGHKNVISVPNGAANTEYLDNVINILEEKEKIYIATDVDSRGIELRDELIRRIGFDKCYIVSFKECKDPNEYFIKYGGVELSDTLKNAKIKQIEGVIKAENIYNELSEYFKQGDKSGLSIGFEEIDDFITWETSRLAIVTGVPASGKSEFVDYVVTKLNMLHGWKAAFFTPENYPLKYHYEKLYEKLIGKKFNNKVSNSVEFDMAYEYINDNFIYIQPEEETTLKYILERTKYLIKTKGIKVLVIDPYNKIEHQYERSETQYISKFLDKLIHFGKLYDILIFLIAHPRKMDKGEVPTLYDISGSANFYNKADYGFTVHRDRDSNGSMTNDVEVHWQKIKFKNLGKQGVTELRYNYNNGRFESRNDDINRWDNKNWLSGEVVETMDNISDDNSDLPFGIGSEDAPF